MLASIVAGWGLRLNSAEPVRVCDVFVRGGCEQGWGVIAIPGCAEGIHNRSEGNRDDGRHVGAGRAGAQEGLGFAGRMFSACCRRRRSSGACREVPTGARGFREFELDLRGALLERRGGGGFGGSVGADAESGVPARGACGSAMVRRGTRSTAPLSLFGPLSLRRGYWTCGCSKGGRHRLTTAGGVPIVGKHKHPSSVSRPIRGTKTLDRKHPGDASASPHLRRSVRCANLWPSTASEYECSSISGTSNSPSTPFRRDAL